MSSVTPKAIVFNCQFNGLSIVQALGKEGIPCIAMDTHRAIGTYSKFAQYVQSPDPAINESRFVDFLYEYCAKERVKPVLFPTNDHWATAISKHKDKLSTVAHLCVADWAAVRTVVEKDSFYAVGQQRGYMTPTTWSLEALNSLRHTDFPIAAKPVYRRNSTDEAQSGRYEAMDRLRLSVFNNVQELNEFLDREANWLDSLVFQTYVPGLSDQMYTVGIYANQKHELRGIFTGRKVRGFPADIGDCIVGENYLVPEELIENTSRVTRELGLSGIAEFEYKKNPESNQYILIEINPRSWSWIGITPACGVNLPLIAYGDLTNRAPATTCQRSDAPDGTIRYTKILQDALNTWFYYRNDYPAWVKTPMAWWNEHRHIKLICAEFNAGDHPVGLMSVAQLVRTLVKQLVARSTRRSSEA